MISSLAFAAVIAAAAVGSSGGKAAAAPGNAPGAAVAALPGDAKAEGRGYAELTEAWWRWAYRLRDGMRPTQDPTGAQCHVGQAGAVWFLAGTAGTGKVDRTCTVPEGSYLFVPVFIVLETSMPGRRRDCDALRAAAGAEATRRIAYRVELDGAPLTPVRSASRDCFDAYADAQDDDVPPGVYAPASTDGLWLLLPPLEPGRHRLVVDARQESEGASRSRFDQQFTYVLDVGGAPPGEDQDEPPSVDDPEVITL